MEVVNENETLLKQDEENTLENNDDDETSNDTPEAGICNKLKGVTCAFADAVCNAASATCVQLLERRIPDLELNAFRNAIPLVLYSIVLGSNANHVFVYSGYICVGVTFLHRGVSAACRQCYHRVQYNLHRFRSLRLFTVLERANHFEERRFRLSVRLWSNSRNSTLGFSILSTLEQPL